MDGLVGRRRQKSSVKMIAGHPSGQFWVSVVGKLLCAHPVLRKPVRTDFGSRKSRVRFLFATL